MAAWFKHRKKYKIIVVGLIVHVLLLLAVFDVYFASPLDRGMSPVKSTNNPPAKRLVLFVADGLRAEAVFGNGKESRIPFLYEIMSNGGSWGVAHTRVPTESRPGHVALLAGIYEDPSAILSGWKANPVHFDSVINQSTNAWCWGSPDIVHIFNKDARSHIRTFSYDADIEDFGKSDTGVLDEWVFREVKQHFQNCNKTCDQTYFNDGNLYFLHLLGIDTAGHGYKPHSNEYVRNIRLVDENIKETVGLFERFYNNDNSTVFIFTADHGMTDWGSHGSGSDDETNVPFIAWGAGIKTNEKQRDVSQIDVAPLLASLIGANIPINSLGVTPLEYLDVPEDGLAEIRLSNTQQLFEMFKVKCLRTENNALVFVPFHGKTLDMFEREMDELRTLFQNGSYENVINTSQGFIAVLKRGIDYYHNYYKYPLLISVSLGLVGWVCVLVTSLISNMADVDENYSVLYDRAFVTTILTVVILCYVQKFHVLYYFYFTFPVVIWWMAWKRIQSFFDITKRLLNNDLRNLLFYFVGVELLVFGFFNRASFTVLMIVVGFFPYKNTDKREEIVWMSLSWILSVFPLLPVMRTSFNLYIFLIGVLVWLGLFYEMYMNRITNYHRVKTGVFRFQFICFVSATVYVLCLERGLISNDSCLKYVSWLLLVAPIGVIPFTDKFIVTRLIGTFFGFAPFYVLVSSNFELLFAAIYVGLLCHWLMVEARTFETSRVIYYVSFDVYKGNNEINPDMFRRGFLFVVFIFVGFFGTGNIASLNSFDPMWVRAFLTVFSPFKMAGLILLKISVPFIFACCVFRAINSVGKENVLSMFCIILMFSDVMVLQFLFMIQNSGSWLEIGTSLSHFVIMEGFVTILLLLYGFAHVVTTISYE